MDYINDITTIVEGRLPLPYITLNEKPLCWGVETAEQVLEELKKKLAKS